jgi:hypothetical protein
MINVIVLKLFPEYVCSVKLLNNNEMENLTWVDFANQSPFHREIVSVITTASPIPITACFDTIRGKWYFYDFSDNEWYELASSVSVVKWFAFTNIK